MNRTVTIHLAAVLLTFIATTATSLAQSAVRRPAPAKKTTSASRPQTTVKPRATSPTRTAAATPAKAPQTQSAPAQAVAANQPQSQPTATPAASTPARRTSAYSAPSRRSSVSHRDKYLNLGVGLLTYYGGGLPLGASFEVDVKNNFSVGGSVDYFRYNYGYYSGGYNFIYAGARASYHLGEALNVGDQKFDPYVGATLGFRHASYRDSYGYSYYDYGNGYNSGLFIGIHLGARYMFSEHIGGFTEVGYGVSALKLGLTAKF
ncbi:hypothetical protein ACFSUS_15620 [Spirosoma soli]|uniref:Outer membrane beta-barrel protein n=1 Tax=Spirosoma soli TaxID=1770529 RepID=A0ABW5M4X3_9BACT